MVWKLAAAGSTCEDKDEVAPDNKDEELVASEVAAYLSFILAPAAVRKWPSCTYAHRLASVLLSFRYTTTGVQHKSDVLRCRTIQRLKVIILSAEALVKTK